ncbi:hypothetical protein [Namhaeicola litoreus]|uniref:Uncharacterized protein n=1 Tax=Namhaeicola litoreus TaxID=1052145 RepID=A0ABW3Y0A8_9FLAO
MMSDSHSKAGFLGGTLFSAFFNVTVDDLVFTVVMAAVGAVVSFGVSVVMKRVFEQRE